MLHAHTHTQLHYHHVRFYMFILPAPFSENYILQLSSRIYFTFTGGRQRRRRRRALRKTSTRWPGVSATRRPAPRRPAPAAVVASASPSSSRDVALVTAGSGTRGSTTIGWRRREKGIRWPSAAQAGARVTVVPGTRAGVGGVQRTLSPRLESTEHGVVLESWRHPTP